jgi:DNA-binding Xre family transcriptional regulator
MIPIFWTLPTLMQQRGCYHTSDLHRRLSDAGLELSRQAIFRLVKEPPERLALDTLGALCEALQCTPGDLLRTQTPCASTRGTMPPPHFTLG